MREIYNYPEKHRELLDANVPKASQLARRNRRKVQPIIVYAAPKGLAFVVNYLRDRSRYYLPEGEHLRLNQWIGIAKDQL